MVQYSALQFLGQTFTYLVGSDAAALLFNSKNENLNAEEVYGKLTTPVFGKGVAYDVPNPVCVWFFVRQFGTIVAQNLENRTVEWFYKFWGLHSWTPVLDHLTVQNLVPKWVDSYVQNAIKLIYAHLITKFFPK